MSTIVYVSNAESGDISVLRLDLQTGALAALQTIELGGTIMPLACSPDRRFLYAARRSDPLAVTSLGIDRNDGRLTRLGEAPLPASMAYIATDHSGRFLLSASYPASLIAVSAIEPDGTVRAAPHQALATAPHAHAIRADGSNRFVFATSLGGGHVMQLRFDFNSGLLAPNEPPRVEVRAGAGPRHIELHPNGRFVYLLNELDASLDVFSLDPAGGTLRHEQTVGTLPPGFEGAPWAADLHLSPDAKFLYSSERRSSTLAGFAVESSGGRLRAVGHWAAQAQPRGFAIEPSGRYLLAAGERSNRVGVHAIDRASGALQALREIQVGRGPNWVEIVQLE